MIQALNSKVTVPKPSRRNPVTEGGSAARQVYQMLRLYAEGRQDLLRLGPVRCMGNNMAVAFWRGYDSIPPHTIPQEHPPLGLLSGGADPAAAGR